MSLTNLNGSNPAVSTAGEEGNTGRFTCHWCERDFSTKSGRTIHEKNAHELEFNLSRESDTVRKRPRWSHEDLRLLALSEVAANKRKRLEAARLGQRLKKFDMALLLSEEYVERRTYNAIRKARSDAAYKAVVAQLEETARPEGATAAPVQTGAAGSDGVVQLTTETVENSGSRPESRQEQPAAAAADVPQRGENGCPDWSGPVKEAILASGVVSLLRGSP